MQLQEMAKNRTIWLSGEGEETEVVLSSRIRLARNISGKPFPWRANKQTQQKVLNLTEEAVKKSSLRETVFLNLNSLDKIDQQFLMERHLISYEHTQANFIRGVVIGSGEKRGNHLKRLRPVFNPEGSDRREELSPKGNHLISMMINEEDHLRLQSLEPGLGLSNAWENLNSLDDELGKSLPFAFSKEWGFLTACPTNTGTGLRASCLMHLPALVYSEEIENVLQNLSKVGMVARGFYGEGTKVLGDFFQISNATTLGHTENEIIDNLMRVIKQIIDYEKRIRAKLLTENINTKTKTEDTICRSYGILANARTITYEETINCLSRIRLGIYLGLDLPVEVNTINEILLFTQPAHLQEIANKELSGTERDILRAEFIREKLNKTKKNNKINQKR